MLSFSSVVRFKDFLYPAMERAVRRDPGKWAARACRGLRVALVVAGKVGSAEIEIEIVLGLKQHTRERFAAGAAGVPIVRAVIDRIDPAARGARLLFHRAVDRRKVGLAHGAACDARLVG